MTSKEDVIREIISKADDPLKLSEVAERFARTTGGLSVSKTYIKQVAEQMAEEGKVTIEKVEENGNLANVIR